MTSFNSFKPGDIVKNGSSDFAQTGTVVSIAFDGWLYVRWTWGSNTFLSPDDAVLADGTHKQQKNKQVTP